MRKLWLLFSMAFLVGTLSPCGAMDSEESSSPQTESSDDPSPASAYFREMAERERSSDGRFVQELGHMLFVLGGILTVVFVGSWFLKRLLNSKIQQVNGTSPVKILERRTLSPKTAIYLVEIAGKTIALAESISGVTPLGDFSIQDKPSGDVPSFDRLYDENSKTES